MGVRTKLKQTKKLDKFAEHFECTWLGLKSLRGRRTGGSFLLTSLCQYANAEVRQKTNNAMEEWHRAIKGSLGYIHSTIFKFEFLRREQSAAENKLIALQVRNNFPKSARYQKKPLVGSISRAQKQQKDFKV